MCIAYYGIPKDEEMSGIAYKVVRKNDDGTYSPYYQYADKKGGGCEFNPVDRRFFFKNNMIYRIGKSYVVKHKRYSLVSGSGLSYPAGVHLYLEYDSALWKFHQSEYSRTRYRYAIIKCIYEKALAIDHTYKVIVAKKITPVEEIMDSRKEM